MKTKAHHHWFLLAVAIVLVYHYRAPLLALWRTSIAPRLAAVLPPSVAAAPGAPAPAPDLLTRLRALLDLGFGGASGGVRSFFASGNLPTDGGFNVGGVGGVPAGRSGGFGGGAIEQGNEQGGGNIGNVPNSFGNCSTNPRDGKVLCV